MAHRILAALALSAWLFVGACSDENETITLGREADRHEECIPQGASCDRGDRCCVGQCDERDHVCRADDDCASDGERCDRDDDCCSELCLANVCVGAGGAGADG